MGTLSDWNSYLGVQRRPNFGDVHTKYDHPDFQSEYFWSASLREFHERMLDTLAGKSEMFNMLITGNPGVGKTSFLYSLRHTLEADEGSRYVLKIFHSNHARGFANPLDAEERVRLEIKSAWKSLYESTGNGQTYLQIDGLRNPSRQCLNDLNDYYVQNKSRFNKLLIFAVDDVDLLDQVDLREIVKYVTCNLEVKSVKKWFFVRPQTYENYDADTKEFLQGFFPDIRRLPRTPLYDLVRHRVTAAAEGSTQVKIPFSPQLCRHVEEITGGNLRRALSALERILCEIAPPENTTLSSEFIANQVDRAAIRALIAEELIPDIHRATFRTVAYPIALDLLSFLVFSADAVILLPCLNDALKLRHRSVLVERRAANPRESLGVARNPYYRVIDFEFTAEKLQRAQLVEKTASAYRLTPLGLVVAKFVNRPYFLAESAASQDIDSPTYDAEYLKYAAVFIDHEEIANGYILRKF